jgi:hypothetical protein
MEPSPEERSKIVNIETLANWAGISAEPLGSPDCFFPSVQQSLFTLLGVSGVAHYRLIAAMPQSDFWDVLNKWKVAGGSPSLGHLFGAKLFHATAQGLCGVGTKAESQQDQLSRSLSPPSQTTGAVVHDAEVPKEIYQQRSYNFSLREDIPQMLTSVDWGSLEEARGKLKSSFRVHMGHHNLPIRSCYGFRMHDACCLCYAVCDSCGDCLRRYKIVAIPGRPSEIWCNDAPCNSMRPAICRTAEIPYTKKQRKAVADALEADVKKKRKQTPREISEDLLGTDAQYPPGRAVQNQKAALVRKDRDSNGLDLNGMQEFVKERLIHIEPSDHIAPYPTDTTDLSFTTTSNVTEDVFLVVYTVLRFVEHAAELAKTASIELGTHLQFSAIGDFTNRICWQGYATGFWGLPVARQVGCKDNWEWSRHLLPISFVTALSENHAAGGMCLRDGQAILRHCLRKVSVVVPAPLLRQINVDWADSQKLAAALSTEQSSVVQEYRWPSQKDTSESPAIRSQTYIETL